jgi:hypothetical protein
MSSRPLTTLPTVLTSGALVSSIASRVSFEQAGSHLTAVEIARSGRSPLIASLHRSLVALGIVISSYQARTALQTGAFQIVERVVFERRDGGALEAQLGEAAKAAILELVTDETEGRRA